MHMSWTPQVFGGVGILTSIFCPISVDLKFDLTITLTSILPFPVSLTSGMTRKGRLISLVVRYLISSNSPSGGINDIEWSDSNLLSFTHWWNWISSMAIELFPPPPPLVTPPAESPVAEAEARDAVLPLLLSIVSLSLMPNLHSGIPDR